MRLRTNSLLAANSAPCRARRRSSGRSARDDDAGDRVVTAGVEGPRPDVTGGRVDVDHAPEVVRGPAEVGVMGEGVRADQRPVVGAVPQRPPHRRHQRQRHRLAVSQRRAGEPRLPHAFRREAARRVVPQAEDVGVGEDVSPMAWSTFSEPPAWAIHSWTSTPAIRGLARRVTGVGVDVVVMCDPSRARKEKRGAVVRAGERCHGEPGSRMNAAAAGLAARCQVRRVGRGGAQAGDGLRDRTSGACETGSRTSAGRDPAGRVPGLLAPVRTRPNGLTRTLASAASAAVSSWVLGCDRPPRSGTCHPPRPPRLRRRCRRAEAAHAG